PCQVEVTILEQSECNDNGTPTNPNDDFITVIIQVDGVNVSDTWEANVRGTLVTGAYGVPTVIRLDILNQVDETVFIAVSDSGDATCTDDFVIFVPESCSDDCVITPAISTQPFCDDGGTPSDPTDDAYFFVVTVAGDNTGADGWFAVDGQQSQTWTGNYNEPTVLGPYTNFGDGPFNILFRDVEKPDCGQSLLSVTPPEEACSFACEISISMLGGGPICDPNGTDIDPTDDVYYVFVQIDGVNSSLSGWVTDDIGWPEGEGEYGGTFEFGPYPIGENHTIVIRDAVDPECEVSLPLISPPACPSGCELDIETFPPICDNNGTPFYPSDDTYTVGVRIIPAGPDVGNDGWRFVLGNGQFEDGGPYGEIVTLGPFAIPADGADTTFTIADNTFLGCTDEFTIVIPPTCSDLVCDMVLTEVDKRCDDNGTPFDITDDIYYFTLGVDSSLPTSGWTVTTTAGTFAGLYGDQVEIGPFPVGEDVTITVFDQQYPDNCSESLTVATTEICSEEVICVIESTVEQIYNDGGTPLDHTDDTYDLIFNVTNGTLNGIYSLEIFNGPVLTGTYGEPLLVEGYTANEDVSYTIIDLQDETCTFIDRLFGQAVLGNYTWIDLNEDGIQDANELPLAGVTVTLNGTDLLTDLPVSAQMVTNEDGLYLFTNLSQGVYDVTFELPDGYTFTLLDQGTEALDSDADPDQGGTTAEVTLSSASANLDVDAGFVQLPACEIMAGEPVTTCINSQSFTITIDVDGTNAGSGWTATDNVTANTYSGQYGEAFEADFSTAFAGPIVITFVDVDDPSCTATASVAVPTDCEDPDPCAITVTSQVFECNDQGTDTNDDDTFDAFFAATGTEVGSCFTYTVDGVTQTGTYGIPVFLSGNLIANGDIEVIITDCDEPTCGSVLILEAPAPCSVDCAITLGEIETTCLDGGLFQVSIPVTAVAGSAGWQAVDNFGNNFSGAYGDALVAEYPVDLSVPVILTVLDSEDPACTANTVVEVPEECIPEPCDLEVAVFNNGCDDMGSSDEMDDTFSGSFRVSGAGTSDCFTYTINDETFTGDYNQLIAIGPFLIIEGDVLVEIEDCADSDCVISFVLEAPETPCSTTLDCSIACPPDVTSEELGLGCSALDNILNNPESVLITGEPIVEGVCQIAVMTFVDELSESGT
ncbi:MAG: SdrD B-like domain-containing protein, partial [Bacteroidota bacterium]